MGQLQRPSRNTTAKSKQGHKNRKYHKIKLSSSPNTASSTFWYKQDEAFCTTTNSTNARMNNSSKPLVESMNLCSRSANQTLKDWYYSDGLQNFDQHYQLLKSGFTKKDRGSE